MSTKLDFLTPVGRLVMGSLYTPQTKDAEGKIRVYKSGPNIGQPRPIYFFALAIPKGTEQHWTNTEWGAKVYAACTQLFPGGEIQSPIFAWKIVDGDSQVPNSKGIKPCDREAYPGNWVITFSSSFPSPIYNHDGTKLIAEKDAVNLGDYVQVFGNIVNNGSKQNPGIIINHRMIAHIGYGERIVYGPDAESVGFGKAALPAGVSRTPITQGFNPVTAPVVTPPPIVPAPIPQYVTPHPQILTPPAAASTSRVMLPKANGVTYEQYIAAGYTDAVLIQLGLMAP